MTSTVKDIMTTHVVWVKPDAPYKEMAARMRALRVSAFPVLDHAGLVVGVVSEADMLTKEALDTRDGLPAVFRRARDCKKADGITAADLMTSPAITVSPDDSVQHAARLMYTRKVKRLPVVTPAGQLAGIVSRTDILAVFDRKDGEIRTEITGAILREFLMDPRRFQVTVKDGVVTLQGEPETASMGHDLVRHARHVQGVVAVRDRLTYPEPDLATAPGFYTSH
jgi:CBS domain-containing protein